MAQANHSSKVRKKQLTAQKVHALVQQVLLEQWPLDMDMEDSDYEAQDIWDVVIAASVEQFSLSLNNHETESIRVDGLPASGPRALCPRL